MIISLESVHMWATRIFYFHFIWAIWRAFWAEVFLLDTEGFDDWGTIEQRTFKACKHGVYETVWSLAILWSNLNIYSLLDLLSIFLFLTLILTQICSLANLGLTQGWRLLILEGGYLRYDICRWSAHLLKFNFVNIEGFSTLFILFY